MRRFKREKPIEEPTVNLTPLIDVVFVILIIFIVIAPILELDQINLADAPQEKTLSIKDTGPITLHVYQDDRITLNDLDVDIGQLPHLLKIEKRKHPSAFPQVFHDKRAHFGTYQSVKNAAEFAGFDQIDVILRPA